MAVREVWAQCQLGQAAFGAMRNGVGRGSTDLVFSSMHAFLSHAGNVAKILRAREEPTALEHLADTFRWWPWLARLLRKLERAQSRPTIGDLIGVDKASLVYYEARRFRNNLEHYEEGLIRWLRKKGPDVNILDFNIMPKDAIRVRNGIFVRNLNPNTGIFTLADKDLNVPTVVDELKRIQGIARKWLDDNGYR